MQIFNAALESVPKDRQGKISKEYLRVGLDTIASSAGLPPIGAVEEVISILMTNLRIHFIGLYINQLIVI